jgi:acetate kinase
VFDTAFHTSIPQEAKVYPIPYQWYEKGIQRYGFHGISHQYCDQRTAQILGKPLAELKMITCHLGNGCSITAIKNGLSINTSMGFTPLEGVMMGARSGSIDPAILIHLMREYGYTAEQLNQMLNQESGLKGVSGSSADMRTISAAMENNDRRAKLAFEIYIHRLKSVIASMLPHLGGLDVLVFTAGVGENAAKVREDVCQGFEFLDLRLDRDKNSTRCWDRDIANADSHVRVVVVHTQEDWAIAQQCWHIYQTRGN